MVGYQASQAASCAHWRSQTRESNSLEDSTFEARGVGVVAFHSGCFPGAEAELFLTENPEGRLQPVGYSVKIVSRQRPFLRLFGAIIGIPSRCQLIKWLGFNWVL